MIFPDILKIDLNQSNKSLRKIFDELGVPFNAVLEDRKLFDVIFYKNNNGVYVVFAYIRKGSTKIEFIEKYINSLKTMDFTDDKRVVEIFNDSKKINENLEYLSNLKKDEGKMFEDSKLKFNMDDILDKISVGGLKSLTKDEKDFLEANSKNI